MTEDWPQQELTETMSLPLYLIVSGPNVHVNLWFISISGLFQSLVYFNLWSISISGLFQSLVYFHLWSISISGLFQSLVYFYLYPSFFSSYRRPAQSSPPPDLSFIDCLAPIVLCFLLTLFSKRLSWNGVSSTFFNNCRLFFFCYFESNKAVYFVRIVKQIQFVSIRGPRNY